MADEFDELKAAFEAATPAPDEVRKRENIALAEKNFAALQGSRSGARRTVRKGRMFRFSNGVTQMLNVLTTKGGLAASTALVAVGLVAVLPQLENGRFSAPVGGRVEIETRQSAERGDAADALAESVPLSPPAVAGADDESSAMARDRFEAPAEALGQFRRELSEVDSLADAAPPVVAAEPMMEAEESFSTDMSLNVAPRSVIVGGAPAAKRIAPPSDAMIVPEGDTEAYASAPENTLKVTAEEPVSTFSIDVDTASYAVVRSSLTAGVLPPREAVRVEEMVNYFPYDYPAPDGAHPFRPTVSVMETPWNRGTRLVHIGIQGTLPAVEDRPPLNLVFLIDTSGSMQDANKLPLLKQSFRLMLSELRPEDEVSIVTYAGSAGQILEPTRAAERSVILAALDRLEAGGSTAGQEGLQQAYQVAEGMAADGEVTRVILATDGDFNVGLSDPEALRDFIAEKRGSGTYLSILGFGRGNLDDATMQALAQNGNGTAAYIDTLSEARKVLVDQLTGALFPIANDVKIQVEFNPAEIAEYRLIGYETRALRREDFNNDRIDAGDIGAGTQVTAIYEVTPVGSDAIRNGPLRYSQARDDRPASTGELGFLKLRYKRPGEGTSTLIEQAIPVEPGTVSEDARFSVAMAGFGELLRGGTYLGDWGWDEAIALASGARGTDPYGYRAEAVTLMRLAEALDR